MLVVTESNSTKVGNWNETDQTATVQMQVLRRKASLVTLVILMRVQMRQYSLLDLLDIPEHLNLKTLVVSLL